MLVFDRTTTPEKAAKLREALASGGLDFNLTYCVVAISADGHIHAELDGPGAQDAVDFLEGTTASWWSALLPW